MAPQQGGADRTLTPVERKSEAHSAVNDRPDNAEPFVTA